MCQRRVSKASKLHLKSESSVSFLRAIILTAFGNEKPLTPKVLSWIDGAQGFFLFSKYYLAYLVFILSFKNCISIGMEQEMNLESFETTRIG